MMRKEVVRLLLGATLGLLTPVSLSAQRTGDPGPVGVVHQRQRGESRPSIPSVAAASTRHHVWPWLVVGGALVGAGTVVAVGAKHCDSGCQDDGGWAQMPYYAAVGAGIGALAGGVLGLIIDSSRGDQAAAANDRR
jgi:hypothetical protein